MYKVLNLVDGITLKSDMLTCESGECDLTLFDTRTAGNVSLESKNKTFLLVVIDDKSELEKLSFSANAWILRSALDQLDNVVSLCKKEIDAYRNGRILRTLAGTLFVHMEVHEHNIEMIREGMRTSAKEIRDIFEAQVAEMRQIHTDIMATKDKMGYLSVSLDDSEPMQLLETTIDRTDEILGRTDKVIKAMFGFVSILQCEDRITQMLDGICKVIDADKEQIQGCNAKIENSETVAEIKLEMVRYYTIQEQRDFANGIMNAYGTCRTATIDIDDDDFTLF